MPRLNSSLVGRTIRNAYPSGGTITIVRVFVDDGIDGPTLCAEVKWNTGNPVLDEGTTIGSIAPGTMLWDELSQAGPEMVPSYDDPPVDTDEATQ